MPTEIADRLRSARLGHALMDAVPGCALEVGRMGGSSVVIGPVGHPGAEVLPCQHRGAVLQALRSGSMAGYARALGLQGLADALYIRLLLPPGADIGTGVVAVEQPPDRRLVVATTLCAHHAVRAARAAQTVPQPSRRAPDEPLREVVVDLRVEARHDAEIGTTLLVWTHRPHPAVIAEIDDAVRAASAACVVEELLLDLRAS